MPKAKILIVEDNPVNLELIKDILETYKYEVIIATNGWEAIDLAGQTLPDLVLMDIQLPGIDGLEATCLLKANPLTSNITVIAITAFVTEADEARAKEAGCDSFITKPINTREFPRLIADFLRVRSKHGTAS